MWKKKSCASKYVQCLRYSASRQKKATSVFRVKSMEEALMSRKQINKEKKKNLNKG